MTTTSDLLARKLLAAMLGKPATGEDVPVAADDPASFAAMLQCLMPRPADPAMQAAAATDSTVAATAPKTPEATAVGPVTGRADSVTNRPSISPGRVSQVGATPQIVARPVAGKATSPVGPQLASPTTAEIASPVAPAPVIRDATPPTAEPSAPAPAVRSLQVFANPEVSPLSTVEANMPEGALPLEVREAAAPINRSPVAVTQVQSPPGATLPPEVREAAAPINRSPVAVTQVQSPPGGALPLEVREAAAPIGRSPVAVRQVQSPPGATLPPEVSEAAAPLDRSPVAVTQVQSPPEAALPLEVREAAAPIGRSPVAVTQVQSPPEAALPLEVREAAAPIGRSPVAVTQVQSPPGAALLLEVREAAAPIDRSPVAVRQVQSPPGAALPLEVREAAAPIDRSPVAVTQVPSPPGAATLQSVAAAGMIDDLDTSRPQTPAQRLLAMTPVDTNDGERVVLAMAPPEARPRIEPHARLRFIAMPATLDASESVASHGERQAQAPNVVGPWAGAVHAAAPRVAQADHTMDLGAVRLPEAAMAQLSEGEPQRLHLRLDPPHLGQCEIELTLHNGSVHATMMVERADTAAALRHVAPQIRHALGERGLELTGFDVGQGSADSSAWEGRGAPPAWAPPSFATEMREERIADPAPARIVGRQHSGRIDLVA